MRRAVASCSCTDWVVLLLDCCPVHLSHKFIQYCCRAGVIIICVPARATWFLQPLDVYVFAALKRHLAKELHECKWHGSGIPLTQDRRDEIRHEAAKSQLASGRWQRCLVRCGLSTNRDMWRKPLQDLVFGKDLKARPPTVEELAVLIGRKPKQAEKMLPLLLSWPLRLRGDRFSLRPPSWCVPAQRGPQQGLQQASRGGLRILSLIHI